jgi:sugar (pentulose or hexulose) kinase
LYRAILEGIAYGLREGLERMESRCGQRATVLRVAGGGSQSDGAMQITANIFNRPAERLAEFEASGLGAAITSAIALGWYADHAAAIRAMSRIARRFDPQNDIAARYQALYTEVYQRLYPQLKPVYESLHRITRQQ